jgi:ubiquinone/menaquinone biosynthesis C-methylase UbiE
MSVEWYDMIAKRNGGYKSNAVFTVEGLSGENVFEERLTGILPYFASVLDAGCGHGEFTLKMSKYTPSIIGFDNSVELLKIAEQLREASGVRNVKFVYATTKKKLPFKENQFDLIYDRRGPTSIIKHSRILRSGGLIYGIHSAALERIQELLNENGFVEIEIETFNDATIYFPNEFEFTKYISAMHGSPDYTLPENKTDLERQIERNMVNGRLGIKEWRFIWKAKKK